MTEEAKQDWKTERITEYAKLEKEEVTIKHEMSADIGLNKLIQKRSDLDTVIKFAEKSYFKNIEAAQQQQAGIKLELVDRWYGEEKTFECAAGIATLRTTKSLKIQSKQKLIDFLVLNKKLVDFIKSFEIAKLRKIKDAGFLGDEVVSYDETKSIAIKITEVNR